MKQTSSLRAQSERHKLLLAAALAAVLVVISPGSLLPQAGGQFVYVVNNNFRTLVPGDPAPDPERSASTVSGFRVLNGGRLEFFGTFQGDPTALGGVRTVWNTAASLALPPCLFVNHYVGGPDSFVIDPNDGTPVWVEPTPYPPGNSGSAIAADADGAVKLFYGDYFGRLVRGLLVLKPAVLMQTVNEFPAHVVSVRIDGSGRRVAVGTDYQDEVTPARVHVLDTSAPPTSSSYPELPGSPALTGGSGSTGSMAFTNDGRLVVANIVSNTVSVIDLSTMQLVGSPVPLRGGATSPVDVVFHPNSKVYVSCRSGNVQVFSYGDGQLRYEPSMSRPTGGINTDNLALEITGTLLFALNSGNVIGHRSATITTFAVEQNGRLKRLDLTTVPDSNYYPTGLAAYPPAPVFAAIP